MLSPKASRCTFAELHCFLVLKYFNNAWDILSSRNTICLSPKCQATSLCPGVVRSELRLSKPNYFLDGQCISSPSEQLWESQFQGVSVLLVITISIFWSFTFGIFHCYKYLQHVSCYLWQSNTPFACLAARRLAQSTVTVKEEWLLIWYYIPWSVFAASRQPSSLLQHWHFSSCLPRSVQPSSSKIYFIFCITVQLFLLYNYFSLLFLPSLHLLSWCQQLPEFVTFTCSSRVCNRVSTGMCSNRWERLGLRGTGTWEAGPLLSCFCFQILTWGCSALALADKAKMGSENGCQRCSRAFQACE